MAFYFPMRSQSLACSEHYAERITEEPHPNVNNKNAQTTVTLMYQTNIAGYVRSVTILWCKNLMNQSFSITVNGTEEDSQYICKIDLKPWHFWSKKGYKSFNVDGKLVDVYWDLRSAKFNNGGPEPTSDYYVALVADQEVVLLLGDYKKKAYKRTKSRPALVEPLLYYKKENVFAKKSFATRARFGERQKEHDITVESSTSGSKVDPEMWISFDGVVLIHVRNLQWKFRGNQNVLVDKQPVQVMWDVHDWLFSSTGTGHGVFMFTPIAAEVDSDFEGSGHGGESDTSPGSRYYFARSPDDTSEFSLFLCAWKIE